MSQDSPDVHFTQQAIADQSAEVRDPADDSGELDDPSAMVETYPAAFDERIAEAEQAIAAQRGSDNSPLHGQSRATDNDRDNQMNLTTESERP